MIWDKEKRPGVRVFRTFLRLLVASLYRLEVRGGGNVPRTGPVLFVSNHLAYADPMVISAATAKPIRFLMWRTIYEYKPLHWFFRLMREIPISPNDSPRQLVASLKEARQALEQGDHVGLFAEGAISRFSQTRGFRNGMEHIMRGVDAVIIPTHIDRMWGSIFSFERGKFIWKKPRLGRLPITISFGKPLPPTTLIHEVRQAVMELGAEAFEHRLKEERPLQEAFLRQAKNNWSAPCLLSPSGENLMTYGQLATSAVVLARRVRRAFPNDSAVGILFPSSHSSTLSLLGVLFAGKTPVPLDPSLSKEKIESLCSAVGLKQIITSREIHEKFGFAFQHKSLYLDEIRPTPHLKRLAIAASSRFLPRLGKNPSIPAAVLFGEPTQANPRPIAVQHATITACLLGLQEVLALSPKDVVASALPVSDTLAFTTAFWWPLLRGARIKHEGEHVLIERRFAFTRSEHSFSEKTAVPHLSVYTRALVSMVCVSALDVKEGNEDQKGGKAGTVGRPLPGVSVRIVDPQTGQKLPPGKMGLLHVKNIALGKMENDLLTKDGWFNTGDQAACDEDGFITFPRPLSLTGQVNTPRFP